MNDNGSVIGWLVINGTNVNYPIVQNTADNEFFFYHDINGQESISGSIYLDSAHSINEYGLHTVYGREQADGCLLYTSGPNRERMVYIVMFVFTVIGMICRYLLEFGEVSNTYNLTLFNIVSYLIIIPIGTTIFYRLMVRRLKR